MQAGQGVTLDVFQAVADPMREVLGEREFGELEDGTESNFVLADDHGLEVDVHAFVFDEAGNGVYRMRNGEDWILPCCRLCWTRQDSGFERSLRVARGPGSLPRLRLCAG